MAEDGKTYQPGWGEKKKHHHLHTHANEHNRGLGGALRMKDKQAYYGLMFVLLAVLALGAYKLVMMFVHEWRAMPHDDPTTEMKVDELRIHKVEERDALLYGDSLAQAYQIDSSAIRHVQIETRPVYRPPRKQKEWYITQREWKAIWKQLKVWRWNRKREQENSENQ
ncbi:MAG: hypothetical protein IKS76_03235 [Paludibacteraceae bacterium]|nr:hypothetical protein [Paludibacteraceae bacterium]